MEEQIQSLFSLVGFSRFQDQQENQFPSNAEIIKKKKKTKDLIFMGSGVCQLISDGWMITYRKEEEEDNMNKTNENQKKKKDKSMVWNWNPIQKDPAK